MTKLAKIYISHSTKPGLSASGYVLLNPFTHKIEKSAVLAESGETYLAALIRGLIKAISVLESKCDIDVICDYNYLENSIFNNSKYPKLNSLVKSAISKHGKVAFYYAGVHSESKIMEAKDIAKKAIISHNSPQDLIPDYISFTDGSCNNLSPYGEGGAAYVILDSMGNIIKQNSKGFLGVTNNKMELLAIVSAVAATPPGSVLKIYTDSQYCIKVLTNKANANNFTRPNANIIRQYFNYAAQLKQVQFEWVKGHNGNEYNELCDALADSRTEEMRTLHNIPVYDRFNSPKCNKAGW